VDDTQNLHIKTPVRGRFKHHGSNEFPQQLQTTVLFWSHQMS